jgi:hypothetical protein
MRIVEWDGGLVNKLRAQALDDASGCTIVGVAGNRDRPAYGADKWCHGPTRLQCVAVTSKTLLNFKPDVASGNPNMFRVADPKIDMSNIRAVGSQNAEMKIWNESTGGIAGHNPDEPQHNFAKGQCLWRDWHQLVSQGWGHRA